MYTYLLMNKFRNVTRALLFHSLVIFRGEVTDVNEKFWD